MRCLSRVALVDVEHQLAEAHADEPGQHGVDRGPFLRDEQHLAAARHHGRDQVRDRLALARARRAVDHQAAAGEHCLDRAALGGVGVEDGVVVLGVVGPRRLVRVRGGADQLLRYGVAGDRGHQVAVGEQVARRLQVADHRQLGVRERADDLALLDREAGHLGVRRRLGELPGDAVGRRLVDDRAEHARQLVQQHRVHLDVVVEREVEVVVPGPRRGDGEPAQQHRRGRLEEQLVPPGQAGGQVARPDAALFGQLAGLAVDRLHAADRVGALVRVREQLREPCAAGLLEPLEDVGIGARQVERAGPSVFVVQQRVPPAEIGQRVDPLALRGGDQLETAGVVDLAGF